MRNLQVLVILSVILCLLCAGMPASAGTFKDRDGATHSWDIDDGHTLVWEKSPYMPFAVIFEPRYLTSAQTDENWTADEQDIQAFKLAGITDILLKPGKGVSAVPPAALQRVLDMLEANGLHYGVEISNPVDAPFVGYLIQPTVNRVDGIDASGPVAKDLPGAEVAIYALCDAHTGEVKEFGREVIAGAQIKIPVTVRTGESHVMLFYPKKAVAGGSLFNVWNGFDGYRDRLTLYLSQIKFGKGLRFFADPFTENFGISGEVENLIPTSTLFRFEYATWLSKKYSSPGDLNIAWGILKHDITSFDEASRLIPLWNEGRGAPLIYDDGMAKAYPVDALKSAIWSDFREFRAASVRTYMDAMADVLKRTAADVPVIYTANGLDSIYQPSGAIGYDGLAAPGSDGAGLVLAAGHALSLAEGSSRKMWIVSRLKPSGAAYPKKQDLFTALNGAHNLGAKGVLVSDAQGVEGANLISWLAEYASLSAGDKVYAAYQPHAIYYPQNAMRAVARRLSNGSWWLPSLAVGNDLYLGKSFAGYSINDSKRLDAYVCIWSLKGTQVIHLVTDRAITVTNASDVRTEVKSKKGRVEYPVTEEPVFIRGIPEEQFLPVEVVAEAIQDLQNAIARAEQKRMDTSDYKTKLRDAQAMPNANQLMLSLDLVHGAADEIAHRMRGLDIMPGAGLEKPTGK